MTIREYTKAHNHEIIGKLTRHPEWEYETDEFEHRKHTNTKAYADEGGNVYYIGEKGVCIVTAEDDVI